jgi:predicted aconitase with swiveling domain
MYRSLEMRRLIYVKRAHGASIEGEVLVMREGFSPRYDLDRISGIISRIGHSVEGESIHNKILVIPTVKGGVAGGWAFFDLIHKNISPKALVFGKLNPVMVQGAVLAGLTVTEGWSEDLLSILKNGDHVRIDPEKKMLEIFS